MEKILKSGALTVSQKQATIAELINKCRIYSQGCLKRGKIKEAALYSGKATAYTQMSENV